MLLSASEEDQSVVDICILVTTEMGRLIFYRVLVWPGPLPTSEIAWQAEERVEERETEGKDHYSLPQFPRPNQLGAQLSQRKF